MSKTKDLVVPRGAGWSGTTSQKRFWKVTYVQPNIHGDYTTSEVCIGTLKDVVESQRGRGVLKIELDRPEEVKEVASGR